MKVLLKNIRIVSDQKIGRNKKDIFIKKGIITEIGKNLETKPRVQVVDCKGAYCSPGWIDVGVQACDPGYEHREDLQSATAAAQKGGFSDIALFPNTNPTLHSQSEITYIKSKTANSPVGVHPIGAISHDCKGENLAELYDMHQAGAVAFSDGTKSIKDAGLLSRALRYSQAFGGLIFDVPQDHATSKKGQMHEGAISTQLGLPGIPVLSEVLAIQRNIELLAYSGGRLHLHTISTAEGVDLVRKAKARGLALSCSVALANLCFTDAEMENFDSNWKVAPPLRSEADRIALIEGIKDGTVDFICSNHIPWDEEAKNLEFPYAKFGMLGLQTALPLSLRFLSAHLSISDIVRLWTTAPRKILGLDIPKIKVGAPARLTLFQKEKWILEQKDIASKSQNSPFIGWGFDWKVLSI